MRKSNDPGSLLNVDAFIHDTYPQYPQPTAEVEVPSKRSSVSPSTPTLLIEANTLLREGLRRILTGTEYNVVACGSSLEDIGCTWASHSRPQLLIVGIS